jgi:DNA ligase-1
MTAIKKNTLLGDLAEASEKLAGTRSRRQKTALLVELLAKVPEDELAAAVGWLIEEPLCGPLGIGFAQLSELAQRPLGHAGIDAPVSLREVEVVLGQARGRHRAEAHALLAGLFDRLRAPERALLVGSLTRSLRQGSLGGVMLVALARLSGRSEGEVRRSAMVAGSIAAAAGALVRPEGEGKPTKTLELFRPVTPMLAASAESLREALDRVPDALVEWKVDGLRAQVHKEGARIAIYSRQGNDITEGCASIVPALAALQADAGVFDGEVVLVGQDELPRPFQDSFSAIAAKSFGAGNRLKMFLFDCLHRNGVDLLDEPLSTRLDMLRTAVPIELRMPNARTAHGDAAEHFYRDAIARGHEGVVVKDLASPYRLGARGHAWQKVKEFTSADLVVLAAEWGSGRRRGFLSNLHLGARQKDGAFCMVGKTFKGLTDEMLRWQTERLQELAIEHAPHVVRVEPALVVEVRFNAVQRSSRYPGGVALRFARVVRYREDKAVAEAEELENLLAMSPGGTSALSWPRPRTRASAKEQQKKRQLSLFDDEPSR